MPVLGDLKSGTPAAVLMPAPTRTMTLDMLIFCWLISSAMPSSVKLDNLSCRWSLLLWPVVVVDEEDAEWSMFVSFNDWLLLVISLDVGIGDTFC